MLLLPLVLLAGLFQTLQQRDDGRIPKESLLGPKGMTALHAHPLADEREPLAVVHR